MKTYTIYFTSSIKGKIKEFKEDFCTYMDRYADSVTNLMDSTGKGNAKFSDKCSAAITAGLSYTENAVDKILEAMDKANAEFQCFEDKCVVLVNLFGNTLFGKYHFPKRASIGVL